MVDLAKLFPYDERREVLRKSNIMFKLSIDEVLRFWKRFADPLRGTIVRLHNMYVLVPHDEPHVIHVSDVARMLIYGSVGVNIVDEKRLRILARGILYHYLFRRKFGGKVRAVFELPIVLEVEGYLVVGNIDIVIPETDGFYVVELKSSDTENVKNFGVIQAKMYWTMLDLQGVRVLGAFVSTPKEDVAVDRPLTRRELRRLVSMYAERARKKPVVEALDASTLSLVCDK